ncbi:MAG TPA: hypothetical protein VME19_06510 [Streptosporangiaceae bacterium]|nr:hypothetical protein [Streptosporangiaceae bacterium]
MNDAEETARRLFAMAAEDVPPGIDLLHGVRARSRARVVRTRSVVAVGAAGIVAAATVITLSAVQAPSAFAQVSRAAALTAATSYQVSETQKIVAAGGKYSQSWTTASGEFDPARGVGEGTDNLGDQIRFAGGYAYRFVTAALRTASGRKIGGAIPAWASWERLASPLPPGANATTAQLAALARRPAFLSLIDPQDMLALLESATQVSAAGAASGPGWTGSAYTFGVTFSAPSAPAASISGTVDVDAQGRVRQLTVLDSVGQTERNLEITFGDFGLPVSVSAPPASETFIPPTP